MSQIRCSAGCLIMRWCEVEARSMLMVQAIALQSD